MTEDRYIVGTRLRPRKVEGESVQFKLGKKHGPSDVGAEQVVSAYLEEGEHTLLAELPAYVARKRRFSVAGGVIDQYIQPAGLIVFEVEFTNLGEANAFVPPAFVGTEITGNSRYSGFAIARQA